MANRLICDMKSCEANIIKTNRRMLALDGIEYVLCKNCWDHLYQFIKTHLHPGKFIAPLIKVRCDPRMEENTVALLRDSNLSDIPVHSQAAQMSAAHREAQVYRDAQEVALFRLPAETRRIILQEAAEAMANEAVDYLNTETDRGNDED